MEGWVAELGWVGFDAANNLCPTDRYVRLAVGLDAVSAAPIRGVRRGSGAEEMAVAVAVTLAGQ
jgi:transglutaminase-like putative cysteine protease